MWKQKKSLGFNKLNIFEQIEGKRSLNAPSSRIRREMQSFIILIFFWVPILILKCFKHFFSLFQFNCIFSRFSNEIMVWIFTSVFFNRISTRSHDSIRNKHEKRIKKNDTVKHPREWNSLTKGFLLPRYEFIHHSCILFLTNSLGIFNPHPHTKPSHCKISKNRKLKY